MVLGLLVAAWQSSQACESCGCGISLGDPSLLMQQQAHFIGLVSSYQSFLYPETRTTDYFLQTELWGRWMISPRWAATVRLPWHEHHRRSAESEEADLTGLGDLRVQVRYLAWQVTDTTRRRQWLFLQSEWRLPSSRLTQPEGATLPFRFYPGQRQWMHRFSVLHGLQLSRAWSLTTEVAATHSLETSLEMKSGWQTTLSSFLARHWESETSRKSLWAGLGASVQGRDVENGYYRNDTGGQGLAMLLGGQWEARKWTLGVQGQVPAWQHFGDDALVSQPSGQLIVQYRL